MTDKHKLLYTWSNKLNTVYICMSLYEQRIGNMWVYQWMLWSMWNWAKSKFKKTDEWISQTQWLCQDFNHFDYNI